MTDRNAIKTDHAPGTPRIAFDHAGTGDLVLFLHGIGGNRTNWHDQLPEFATHFHAAAWDARGYGASDDYEGPLDFEDIAADLNRLLDCLDAERAHIVGLSMGGLMALDFCMRHPERLTSLVLSGARLSADDRSPAQRAEYLRLRQEPLRAGKLPREMAPAVANTLLAPSATPAHFERLVESMAALHVDSYLKAITASTYYDDWPDLRAIAVPTLLVYGAEDRLHPPSIGRAGEILIPDAAFVEIPEAGHLCNIEKPEAFNRAVLDFLHRH